jgi:hypothetical protein
MEKKFRGNSALTMTGINRELRKRAGFLRDSPRKISGRYLVVIESAFISLDQFQIGIPI